jgi:hypothetical protein
MPATTIARRASATFCTTAILSLLCACTTRPSPPPVPGGLIGVLAIGAYSCETPGDSKGPAGKPMPDFDFRIVNASSYKAGGIRGSYLYTGDRVVMTGGKLKGLKLRRISAGFMRQITDAGTDGEMRCVLTSGR